MRTLHPPMKLPWVATALAAICCGICFDVTQAGQTIHVKVLVDEEEPRRVQAWQQTLAQRIDHASDILAQYCDLRFSVTRFGTWQSDNRNADYATSLKEFEKKVIREGSSSIRESERLEVLVHELSHYLGAAHSGRGDSVMRPVLGDGRSRARAFRIVLDPPNAEIIQLVSSEVLDYRVRHVHQLTIPTKLQLREQYLLLARDNPRDQVARKYALLMDKSIHRAIAQAQQRQRAATTNPALHQNLPPNVSAPQR